MIDAPLNYVQMKCPYPLQKIINAAMVPYVFLKSIPSNNWHVSRQFYNELKDALRPVTELRKRPEKAESLAASGQLQTIEDRVREIFAEIRKGMK